MKSLDLSLGGSDRDGSSRMYSGGHTVVQVVSWLDPPRDPLHPLGSPRIRLRKQSLWGRAGGPSTPGEPMSESSLDTDVYVTVECSKSDMIELYSSSMIGSQLIRLQFFQLELIFGKTPSTSFRPLNSAGNFWQVLELCSLRVPFALDRSLSKWEPSLWFSWLVLS
ncbi:hypothetical protein Tco_0277841 [Tanacetum coccineum]